MIQDALDMQDIIHEYERTRLANRRLLNRRREEIYEKIPRIEEIESTSKLSYVNALKQRLTGNDADKALVTNTSHNNRMLTKEKRQLLVAAGYPADYLDDIYTCSTCRDTGYVDGKRCSCFRDKIVKRLYIESNLGNILEKENFDTFSLEYYNDVVPKNMNQSPKENMSNVLRMAKSFADSFEQKNTGRGNILLYGETGLGKTFITNCIAKQLLDTGHTVFYLSANELFETVLAGYIINKKSGLEPLYRYIYETELLIIDDLGTESANDFARTQFFEIINKRELAGLSTLISTNLDLPILQSRYTERVMSRIVANYTVFKLYGDNIRYQKRRNTINKMS